MGHYRNAALFLFEYVFIFYHLCHCIFYVFSVTMSTSKSPLPKVPETSADLTAVLAKLGDIQTSIASNSTKLTSLSERMNILEEEIAVPSKDGSSAPSSPTPIGLLGKFGKFPPTSPTHSIVSGKRPLSPERTTPAKKHKHDRVIKKAKRHLSSESSSESEVDEQMQDLLQEYEVTKPKYAQDFTTDSISDKLVPILNRWFWSYYSADEVKAELEKARRPKNCDSLIPTKINEEVYRSILHTSAPGKDLSHRFVHNAFMKAAQPVAAVWASIIRIESHCKKAEDRCVLNMEEGPPIDFHLLRKDLDQALRLLGIANSQMVQLRKEVLKPFLNDDFKKLCRPHIPFTQWMFGDDFKKLLDETIKVNKMIKPIKKKEKQSFLGKGRGGGPPQKSQGSGYRQNKNQGYGKNYGNFGRNQNNSQQPQQNKGRGSRPKQSPQK